MKVRQKAQEERVIVGEYLVEKLIKKRYRQGRREYLVKWLSFPSSENTWEPVENLRSCPELVFAFETKISKRKDRKKKKLGGQTSSFRENNSLGLPASEDVGVVQEDASTNQNPMDEAKEDVPGVAGSNTEDEVDGVHSAVTEVHGEISPSHETVGLRIKRIAGIVDKDLSKQDTTGTGTVFSKTNSNEFDWNRRAVAIERVDRISSSGEMCYKIVWEGSGDNAGGYDYISSSIAREKYPQLIIKYLTSIIQWTPKGAKGGNSNTGDADMMQTVALTKLD